MYIHMYLCSSKKTICTYVRKYVHVHTYSFVFFPHSMEWVCTQGPGRAHSVYVHTRVYVCMYESNKPKTFYKAFSLHHVYVHMYVTAANGWKRLSLALSPHKQDLTQTATNGLEPFYFKNNLILRNIVCTKVLFVFKMIWDVLNFFLF